jgi:hypothetical protein
MIPKGMIPMLTIPCHECMIADTVDSTDPLVPVLAYDPIEGTDYVAFVHRSESTIPDYMPL